MSKAKPKLTYAFPARKLCPVCGMPSYSQGGVHPQCSEAAADAKRVKQSKAARQKAAKTAPPSPTLKAWHKLCPKCGMQVHLRKTVCTCGHVFHPKSK